LEIKKNMKKILFNNYGSAVPLILFFMAIFACGALYTLFFVEFGYPTFDSYIPASDSKTFIMMCLYAIPLFIIILGVICLIKSGLKRTVYYP